MTNSNETPSHGGTDEADHDGRQRTDNQPAHDSGNEFHGDTEQSFASPSERADSRAHVDEVDCPTQSSGARRGARDSSARDDSVDDPQERAPMDDFSEPPMPWSSLDYDYYETDDRHPSLDENAPSLDEGTGSTRTSFSARDVDERREHWNWLRQLQHGRGESERAEQLRQAGIQRDLDIICDRLGATDHQRERAQWLLDHTEVKEQLIPHGPIEAAIMGVATVVIDEDRTREARMPGIDDVQSVARDDAFEQLLADFDLTRSTVHDVRHRLRDTAVYESPN